jgi:hypothetical protein
MMLHIHLLIIDRIPWLRVSLQAQKNLVLIVNWENIT